MEDVYTVKVKTKPDTRNSYPSERRYSASTVSGLAWVHIALAATSFLLACLALVNPNTDIKRLNVNETNQVQIDDNRLIFNLTDNNEDVIKEASNNNSFAENNNGTDNMVNVNKDSNYILVLAPSLVTVFALAAGIASIMASARWYVDRNITWLFIVSIMSTLIASASFIMVVVWFVKTSDGNDDITQFYKDSVPFKDYLIVKKENIVHTNDTHMIIKNSSMSTENETSHVFTKRVLCINILIASVLELLWSVLSVKIAYKGMRNTYNNDGEGRPNCISVVTTIKGNNTQPRNAKPELDSKIKRIFLAQNDNGFYLKTQNKNTKQNTETSSEFYKERMMNFLNRCASLDGVSNPEHGENMSATNDHDTILNPIPEVTQTEINVHNNPEPIEDKDRATPAERDIMTPISWGDTPDHTIYNQNTLNLEKIFKLAAKMEDEVKRDKTDSVIDKDQFKNKQM